MESAQGIELRPEQKEGNDFKEDTEMHLNMWENTVQK